MRFLPRRWHSETWVCSLRGHVAPAARAARLRPSDDDLGEDLPDGTRVVRCLRCDLWLRIEQPGAAATSEVIPPLDQLDLPLRGKPLESRIVLRLIAIERGIHVLLFTAIAILAFVVELKLPTVQDLAEELLDGLRSALQETARAESHGFLTRELQKAANLSSDSVLAIALVSTAYAVVESIEMVGLWRGRRWAEYLTVIATVGFIPFEIRELTEGVSVLKVLALVINLAILAWLLYAKRLFGLRGGAQALQEHVDWVAVLASPCTADAAIRLSGSPGSLRETRPSPPRRTEEPSGGHAP